MKDRRDYKDQKDYKDRKDRKDERDENMDDMDEHGRHGGFDSPEVGCYEVEGADTRGGALGFRPRGRGRRHARRVRSPSKGRGFRDGSYANQILILCHGGIMTGSGRGGGLPETKNESFWSLRNQMCA